MKYIKYMFFTMLLLFLNMFYVNASCTDEEINNLKELADDIKITYKYLGKIEEEDGIFDNQYEVKVKNMPNDLFISLYNGTIILTPSDGEIVTTFNNGTWDLKIYSNNCDTLIDSIEVFIPRFNEYSLDPLCEGIDGDDFPLCGKYYEYEVSYESFKERVNYYRATHNVENVDDEDNVDDTNLIFENLLEYIIKYRLYIVVSLVILLIILILIIIIQRRKKRGVLE